MREKFWGYFPLTEQDFKEIIDDSYIIMDTNILLNFYRYSKETTEKLINILEKNKDRLYLHELVLKEFFKNKDTIIKSHCDIKRNIEKSLNKIQDIFNKEIKNYKHMQVRKKELEKIMGTFESSMKEEIDRYSTDDFKENDYVLDHILDLFNDRMIDDFNEETRKKEIKTAQDRYKNKIPPGYKDENKDENRMYNDYFIWKQTMDFAEKNKKNIIFITEDKKEDWIESTNKPRLELLNEFYRKTNQKIYIYDTNGFFEAMNIEKLDLDIIKEINKISDLNEEKHSKPRIIYKKYDSDDKSILINHLKSFGYGENNIYNILLKRIESIEKNWIE